MFVLRPGGSSGGLSSSSSYEAFQQKLWFVTKLGLYFGAIRLAFLFMSQREEGSSITAAAATDSNNKSS